MQKNKRKRRLRIGRVFLLLLIIGLVCFAFIKFVDIPIRSITIKGNEILTDKEVIELAKLQDYPSYFGVFKIAVEKRLKESPYVSDAKVSKGLLTIKITIKEEKVLYIEKQTGKKITKNDEITDDKIVCAPYLSSEIPSNKKERFKKAMSKINKNILCQMSEIKYDPNEIDKDRYYVFMNDGNSVYLTINKFDKINKYNTILENIGKQNGTLYLDYGDYFEVK